MDIENVTDIIDQNIILDSTASTKKEALQTMCMMLETNGYVSDRQQFYQDVLAREKIGPTGMENGIAIPHGESSAAKHATIAVLKTKKPLEWESLDQKPIHLIFLMVVPTENRDVEHLKMLSHLSAALTHKDIQQKLLDENDPQKFKRILAEAGGI